MTDDQKAPAMRRALRMNSVRADGSPNRDTVELVVRDPFTGLEMRNEDGSPAVSMTLRPMTDDERIAIIDEHTKPKRDPITQRMIEMVDEDGVMNEIMRRAIVDWSGLVACDDQPLRCTDRTKVLLDKSLKLQVQRKLFSAEATEVAADSFREPAGVS